MKNIWTIAWRDFRTYFTSPIAYIVIAGFLFLIGYMFFMNLNHFHMENMRYQQFNMGKGMSITDGILVPVYGNMNVIFLFLAPFITARLLAEERRNNTIQLLMTAPVKLSEVILGKFLSALLLVLVMLLLTITYPVILFATGNPDLGSVVASYVGTTLMLSCYLAIGVLFSSMTENQIVAGALTFVTGLFLWIISWLGQTVSSTTGEILNYLSLIGHYNSFSHGVINTSDVIFYLSFIGAGLFLAHRVMDSYRWR